MDMHTQHSATYSFSIYWIFKEIFDLISLENLKSYNIQIKHRNVNNIYVFHLHFSS